MLSEVNVLNFLNPYFFRLILILSAHHLSGLQHELFHLDFSADILHTFFIAVLCATCPVHPDLLSFITLITFLLGKKSAVTTTFYKRYKNTLAFVNL